MFGVRGVNGEVFRGPFEELLRTHRVDAPAPTRVVQQDAAEASAEPGVPPHDDAHYHAAAAAYAATQVPERGPVYRAYQVMSRRPLVVAPEAGVEHAWRLLAMRTVGQAPVVAASGAVVGLVSRADLLHVLNEEHGFVRDVLARRVADVMTTPVVTVDPLADVRRIARALIEYHLPALPVVDDRSSALVGIVSRSDILRCVLMDPPLTLWA